MTVGNKRGEYVSQACITCRSRKTKTVQRRCHLCGMSEIGQDMHLHRGEAQAEEENEILCGISRTFQLGALPHGPFTNCAFQSSRPGSRRHSTSFDSSEQLVSVHDRLAQVEANCSWIQNYVSSTQQRQLNRTASEADITTNYVDDHQDNSSDMERGYEEHDRNLSHNMNRDPVDLDMAINQADVNLPQTSNDRSDIQLSPPSSVPNSRSPSPSHEPQRSTREEIPGFQLLVESPNLSTGKGNNGSAVAPFSVGIAVPLPSRVDMASIRRELALNNGAAFRPSWDVFFRFLNPLHPVLNENQFREDFDHLIFGEDELQWNGNHAQVMALALLVHAEVKILNEPWTDPNETPGWQSYCTADDLIKELLWRGMADLHTIQCLIFKARYLLYLQRIHQARDAMAIAVRLCLQIGLHDQSTWNHQTTSSFQFTMKQRVFWCIFTIERAVSMTCGMPPMLKTSECSVDLPESIDDRCLFPNRPTPGPTPESSFIPYLHALAKWAKLWDMLLEGTLSRNGSHSSLERDVAALDAEICLQVDSLAYHIQWRAPETSIISAECVELWVWRQRFYYMMRTNLLRLVVRQELLSKSNFSHDVVREIADTAGQTIHNISTHMAIHGHNIDRYFLTVYVSALIAPLACVVLGPVRDILLTQEVAGFWKQAINLLMDISQTFLPACLMLQCLDATIKKVNSQIAAIQLAGENITSTNMAPESYDSQDNIRTGNPVNSIMNGDSAEADFVPFTVSDIMDLVSNSDLWRNSTW